MCFFANFLLRWIWMGLWRPMINQILGKNLASCFMVCNKSPRNLKSMIIGGVWKNWWKFPLQLPLCLSPAIGSNNFAFIYGSIRISEQTCRFELICSVFNTLRTWSCSSFLGFQLFSLLFFSKFKFYSFYHRHNLLFNKHYAQKRW